MPIQVPDTTTPPPLPVPSGLLTSTVRVWLTAATKTDLTAAAKAAGLSTSAYARAVLMDHLKET